jgi:cation:H+ antiporter
LIPALQVLAGLALLLVGGRFLVRAGVTLAEGMGVSPLMIGLTIVAIGTSSPELLVNLMAGSWSALPGSSVRSRATRRS